MPNNPNPPAEQVSNQPTSLNQPATRALYEIAQEIASDWHTMYFGARPYLSAMMDLTTLQDQYGADDAHGIVLYFLANAQTWRGPVARRIKAELNQMLKQHRRSDPR